MKIDGQKFRRRRLQVGLSQKALASGICTQPTISLLEKQNHIPGFRLFQRLCRRMGSDPVDFVQEQTEHRLHFNKIVSLLARGEVAKVQTLIDEFRHEQPQNVDLPHYFYFQGLVNLEMVKLNEALLNFQQVLIHYDDLDNAWEVLATLGIATTYCRLKKYEWATVFLEKVLRGKNCLQSAATLHQKIQIMSQLTYLLLHLNREDQCIDYALQGIQECRDHESTFLLSRLFKTLGEAYQRKQLQEKSERSLRIAHSLEQALLQD